MTRYLKLPALFFLSASISSFPSFGFGLAFHYDSRDDFELVLGIGPVALGIGRDFVMGR